MVGGSGWPKPSCRLCSLGTHSDAQITHKGEKWGIRGQVRRFAPVTQPILPAAEVGSGSMLEFVQTQLGSACERLQPTFDL